MWLVCYYHRHGSLYDYLQQNILDHRHAIRLALTAANGLAHLHTAIIGIRVRCFCKIFNRIIFVLSEYNLKVACNTFFSWKCERSYSASKFVVFYTKIIFVLCEYNFRVVAISLFSWKYERSYSASKFVVFYKKKFLCYLNIIWKLLQYVY